ncbi:MAG: hypothetical protein QOI10_1048 [Solirubrobacterales bacterium]|nr:hypothetical protein [Solirubrobacterales bacterium]
MEPFDSPVTRRQALQAGAAAGLVAMFARVPFARAAADDGEPYLHRASYAGLVGQAFAVAGGSLVLREVGDLEHLAGRDDAFRLEFTGALGAVEAGTRQFSHSALGRFELFVAPVCEVTGGVQRYEVVIDRSVPLPRNAPEAPNNAEPTPPASDAPAPDVPAAPAAVAAAAVRAPARKPVKKRAVEKKPKRKRKAHRRKVAKRKRR